MDASALALAMRSLRMAESSRHPDVDLIDEEWSITDRLADFAVRCKRTAQSFMTAGPQAPRVSMNAHAGAEVVFQCVWASDESVAARLNPTEKSRAGRRFAEFLPLTAMVVVDQRYVLASIPGVSHWDAALAISGPMHVRPYVELFERTYRRARSSSQPPLFQMSEPLVEVIGHLRTGYTDGQIARRMGVTDRTVRRWVRNLHELSATSTRFQLGEWAARHTITASRTTSLTNHVR